jgi:hypothetical protein
MNTEARGKGYRDGGELMNGFGEKGKNVAGMARGHRKRVLAVDFFATPLPPFSVTLSF